MDDEQTDEARPRDTASVDKIVVILNVSHMFMLVMTALFYSALFTDYGTDGTMLSIVALTMVMFSDLAFSVIAISLAVAGRSVKITKGNIGGVWLTIPLLTTPAFPDLYAETIGYFPTDRQIAGVGILLCALLFAWSFRQTIPLWKRANV